MFWCPRSKGNIHWPFEIPPKLEQSAWFQTLPSRQREVLVLASKDRDRDPGSLRFADIYHSANRFATGPPSHVPVCLPRTTLWDFSRGRLLLGAWDLDLRPPQKNDLTWGDLHRGILGNCKYSNMLPENKQLSRLSHRHPALAVMGVHSGDKVALRERRI